MKKVTETKVIERSMFEAIDGTRFETQSECERYEKTALCVLNQKYKNYVVHHGSEYDIWHIGSEEYELDLVVVPTPEAIEHRKSFPTAVFESYVQKNYILIQIQ